MNPQQLIKDILGVAKDKQQEYVSTMKSTLESIKLEAQLSDEIACDRCGKPAQLRSYGHSRTCGSRRPPYYRCIKCWQRLCSRILEALTRYDHISCKHCDRTFTSVDEFSKYEPF